MALVVSRRGATDRAIEDQRPFRMRPLLIPAIALVVWVTYTFRFGGFGIWGNLRWVILVVLAVQGGLEIWKWAGDTPLPWPIIGFTLFSLATFASATYSIIPLLSLYKAISYLLALVGLVFGIGLGHKGRPDSWLRLLATLNLVVVGASLLSFGSPGSYNSGLFQGPFFNPNELGAALALTLPALLWLRDEHLHKASPLLFGSKVLTMAVLLNILLVYLSRSRASLVVVALVLFLHAVFRASKLAWLIAYGMLVLLLVAPVAASQVSDQAVYKGRDPRSAFTTRSEEFGATLRAAESNPIGGYGFGTSADHMVWDGSLSAVAVGREKANAYLGIIEEVGLVGAVPLFLGIGGALVMAFRLARRARWIGNGVPATLLAILAAGVLHANFEAWLTAVGGFPTFIFWSTLGVFLMNLKELSANAALVRP